MGIITGLAKINERLDRDSAPKESSGLKKEDWLKVADGETVPFRFLQELDEASPSYNSEVGVGFVAIEHVSPKDYRRRGLCSAESGQCYGCEQHRKDFKAGWRPKAKLYINVLVEKPGEEPTVKVLSQGNGDKSVTPFLLEYAGDQGSITNQKFKLKRSGTGPRDTSYTLLPGKFDEDKFDVSKHTLLDLKLAVREVPYEEQEAFYEGVTTIGNDVEPAATTTDVDW